jgi:hypothetical protein
MPGRSHTSFQKRQKELMRAEKRRDKEARRLARKNAPKETGDVELQPDEQTEPEEPGEETDTASGPLG